MSDIMRPIPFGQLMHWVLSEYAEQGTIFGVGALYRHEGGKTLPIFGETIETPIGPAAGPHSQLAQNLIAAYAGGARFFEVKTVQIIDGEDLPVEKPCIRAEDECYNVEWSTELRVPEAFDEYVKGWFALKLLSRELGLGSPTGFVFNMSVGYDLAGIQSEKIDTYIEGMKAAGSTAIWRECLAWARANLSRFRNIDEAFLTGLDNKVCKSITLSTLHGCPPDEIERIARYLIEEKCLHTYVKCNPTLLGYAFARETMDAMGYDYLVFDDHHFTHDLQFSDAVPMFQRLQALAVGRGLEFGVKLTNTFPVKIARGELPGGEMYMSGKSLYPLSISLAEKLGRAFDGKLRVSYSGGADLFNAGGIFGAGIWPITMATTLLKPGGYGRLQPIAEMLVKLPYAPFTGVDVDKVGALAKEARSNPHHVKPVKINPPRKTSEQVPLVDCFMAPCEGGCPIGQDIPEYVELVGQGKYDEALEVICKKNPLPFITGTICSHRCMLRCTRNFYEEPVAIRAAKLVAAEKGYAAYRAALSPAPQRPENVAIVGGGPAGMATAHLLALAGAKATIFEKRDSLGGIVRHVIPAFRIADAAIDNDAAMLEKLGVTVKLNTEAPSAKELSAQGYTHVILAIGAWKPGRLALENGKALNVLEFLEAQKKAPGTLTLGERVVVVGGGNTAMDAARAAKRAAGVKSVTLVYRRTKREMPADAEELDLALSDGVEFLELLAPVSHEGGHLLCDVMQLGAPDASGRRSPEPTGERVRVPADTVISAVGEAVDSDALAADGVKLGGRGRADGMKHGNVYVVGDALRGPSTVVETIADATEAATDILGGEITETLYHDGGADLKNRAPSRDFARNPYSMDAATLKARRGALCHSGDPAKENERCLGCSMVCENCVDVCPNRANIAVKVPGMVKEQVLHVDKMCNECGNCTVFCPYDSKPYREKFTVFASTADFEDSENQGFLVISRAEQRVKLRLGGQVYETALATDTRTYEPLVRIMRAVVEDYGWCL